MINEYISFTDTLIINTIGDSEFKLMTDKEHKNNFFEHILLPSIIDLYIPIRLNEELIQILYENPSNYVDFSKYPIINMPVTIVSNNSNIISKTIKKEKKVKKVKKVKKIKL